MASRTREDRRLRLLSAVCLALPESERTNCGTHADFRVHGRIFAYFLRDLGGDGITAACFKSRLGEHVEHVKREPGRFYLPQHIGRRGWFGVRLDQGEVDWDEIARLAATSYQIVGSKSQRVPQGMEKQTNALTSRSLLKGSPARLDLEPFDEDHGDAQHGAQAGSLPGTATSAPAGGPRGRRQ